MKTVVTIPNRIEKEHQLWMLNKCLESLYQCEPSLLGNVIVVDDHSPIDPTPTLSKYNVKLLKHKDRVPYAKMINSSMKVARQMGAQTLITVNNDIEHQVPFLDKLKQTFFDSNVHVVGAVLFYPTGETQHSGVEVGEVDGGPWAYDFYRKTQEFSTSRFCHVVTGAWQAIRVSSDSLNYDESFPFAFEDVDFCLRNWEAGRRVFLDSRIFHIHHESATRGLRATPREVISANLFREKHYNFPAINYHLKTATSEVPLARYPLQLQQG